MKPLHRPSTDDMMPVQRKTGPLLPAVLDHLPKPPRKLARHSEASLRFEVSVAERSLTTREPRRFHRRL